jgi:hypothetical protein
VNLFAISSFEPSGSGTREFSYSLRHIYMYVELQACVDPGVAFGAGSTDNVRIRAWLK